MRFQVTTFGLQESAQGLDIVGQEIPRTTGFEIRKIMRKSKRVLVQQPPQRPGQDYVRTQTLVSGWTITNVSGNMVGHGLQNMTPYTKWVTGDQFGEMQAWMHVNRWPVFRKVVEGFITEAPKNIKNSILMVASNAGLETE